MAFKNLLLFIFIAVASAARNIFDASFDDIKPHSELNGTVLDVPYKHMKYGNDDQVFKFNEDGTSAYPICHSAPRCIYADITSIGSVVSVDGDRFTFKSLYYGCRTEGSNEFVACELKVRGLTKDHYVVSQTQSTRPDVDGQEMQEALLYPIFENLVAIEFEVVILDEMAHDKASVLVLDNLAYIMDVDGFSSDDVEL